MAAPTVRSVGTAALAIGNVTPGLPAGMVAGDLLIMLVSSRSAFATCSGWTVLASLSNGNGYATILYKTAVGSDGRTTAGLTGTTVGRIIAITKDTFNPASPFPDTPTSGLLQTSNTIAGVALTTTVADSLILLVSTSSVAPTGSVDRTDMYSAWACAALTGITELGDNANYDAGGSANLGFASGVKATPGSTGTWSATQAQIGTAGKVNYTISVAPAPPAPDDTTSIDTFDRADGLLNVGAGAAIWEQLRHDGGGASTVRTLSNRMGQSVGTYQSVYTKNDIQADCDILIDCITAPVTPNFEFTIFFCVTDVGTGAFDGYAAIFANGTWIIRRYLNGANAGNVATASNTLLAGDVIWIRKRGTEIIVLRNRSSAGFVQIVRGVDANHTAAGRVVVELSDATQRWDNLRGGPFIVPPVTFDVTIVGAAAVAPDLTVTPAAGSIVAFDCAISDAAAIAAQADSTRSVAATVTRTSAVTAQADRTRAVDATITRASAVAAQADRTRAVDMTIARAAAVSPSVTVVPPIPIAATIAGAGAVSAAVTVTPWVLVPLAASVVGNQPYSGEHKVGTFVVGDENVLAVDLSVFRDTFIAGGVTGQAQVGASMTVVRALDASVAGVGSLSAQQAPVRGLAPTIAGAAAIAAQADRTRALAVSVARAAAVSVDIIASPPITMAVAVTGQAVVAADIIRVPVTVTFSSSVTGAAAVSPSMTVTNASFVNIDATVARQAQVTAQTVNTVSFGCTVARQAAVSAAILNATTLSTTIARSSLVSPDLTVTAQAVTTLIASVQGQATVTADVIRVPVTVTFSCTVARAATVSPGLTVSRIVSLSCTIGLISVLAGQKKVGTFKVGGSSGPFATVTVGVGGLAVSKVLSASVDGQAQVAVGSNWILLFRCKPAGVATVTTLIGQQRLIAALIAGKATIVADLVRDWIGPTDPSGILLPPTTEGSWILVQTAPVPVTLAATVTGASTLTATDEEELLLVPTTEETM